MESWHKVLKYSVGKDQIVRFSLWGTAQHIEVRASVYDREARVKEINFRTKLHPLAGTELAWMKPLPHPVQDLIGDEYLVAKLAWDIGDNTYRKDLQDNLSCECFFWRSYNLPCRHIFTQNFAFGNIMQEDIDRWLLMWEDCGFEVYQGPSTKYIESGIDEDPFAPDRHRDRMREAVESLRHCYYHTEQKLREQHKDSPSDFDKQMANFVDFFNYAVGEVWQKALDQFIAEEGLPVGPEVDDDEQLHSLSSDLDRIGLGPEVDAESELEDWDQSSA